MIWHSDSDKISFPIKIAAMGVVGLFVAIGLIGLVLPIIPGIVFLTLAAMILARVSSRFAHYLDQQPLWHKLRRQWRSLRLLSMTQRLKLMGLYCARSVVNGLDTLIRRVSNRVN